MRSSSSSSLKDDIGKADPMEQQLRDLMELVQAAVQLVKPERGQEGVLVGDWTEIVRDWLRDVREDLLAGDGSEPGRELLECQAENRRLRRREMRLLERLADLQGVQQRNKRLRAALSKIRSDALAELEADKRAGAALGARS